MTLATFQPGLTGRDYFDAWKAILQPWLGPVRPFNLPANPDDMVVVVCDITDRGFRQLTWRTLHANPSWILPKWRTPTGVCCPQCNGTIQALLKNHRTGPNMITGKPYIFCDCVRLQPSRLPSLDFFTDRWPLVCQGVAFLKAVAKELRQQGDERQRDERQRRLSKMRKTPDL